MLNVMCFFAYVNRCVSSMVCERVTHPAELNKTDFIQMSIDFNKQKIMFALHAFEWCHHLLFNDVSIYNTLMTNYAFCVNVISHLIVGSTTYKPILLYN